LGSTGSASTVTADVRAYLPGLDRHHVVAVRAGGGIAHGDPGVRSLFRIGGSAPAGGVLNFDDDAFSLLRGFDNDAFVGSRAAVVNAEYRWPLSVVERGFRTWPLFLHTMHAAAFADLGHAWSDRFRAGDLKTALGGELSADLVIGYSLRVSVTAGAAWGRDGAMRSSDRARFYVRLGRAF
jgi:hypothetical protein